MALAFAGDYQDYAPLPGGNLGTAQQSEILDKKARGKGPAYYMRLWEQRMNFHGVIPRTCKFAFGEQDTAENLQQAQIRTARAQERAARIASGEITLEVARQRALADGDLTEAELELMGEDNLTEDVLADSQYPVQVGD